MEFMSTMKTSELGDGIDDVSENTSQKRKNGTDIDLKYTGSTNCSKRFKNESSEPACIEHREIISKPPLPPKTDKVANKHRKGDDNASQLQRLRAQCNQLRLEIVELKEFLTKEKNAVRDLKAQNDAYNRKEKLLIKKKFEEELQASRKKLSRPKILDNVSATTNDCHGSEIAKMNKEIAMLQKRNKSLEDKLQISSKAERQISSDLRELKDSYELRLTQISKSAKTKIHRLLEELKLKDKQSGQQRTGSNAKSIKSKNAVTTIRANKEKADSSTNQETTIKISTCGNELTDMPHESELSFYKTNKDTSGSDNDSVLSSSPQSLSPQPGTYPTNTDIWQMRSKDSKLLENLQKDYENLQEEYSLLNKKYSSASLKIEQLEKENAAKDHDNSKITNLLERLAFMKDERDKLLKESHELREQNELLEFRIIELEESHDKWSLRSTTTPDTRDMWTDTYKSTTEDYFIPSDRSDSGITSPYNQQNCDDFTHCDLPSIQHDDIRKRILAMLKKPCFDEDDRLCLQQIFSLLTNLETISQVMPVDDVCSGYMSNRKTESNLSLPSSHPPLPLTSTKPNERIIATVQPYSTNSESPFKKARYQSTLSLQESGVFDVDMCTQSTQTETEYFPAVSEKSDLNVEIQKLNKFRKKIEECVTKTNKPVVNLMKSNTCDQQRLQFYKDRLEQLENKILIYESSGDVQVRRLTERLNREIQLESWVKQLTQRVDKLVDDNLQLEEERCELEEAENDTRLRLQRLEVDLEILTQRNMELQMSRDAVKAHANCLQDTINKAQDRIYYLEEQKNDLKHKLEMLALFMPTILLFNTYKVQECQKFEQSDDLQISGLPNVCSCIQPRTMTAPEKNRLNELLSRERELQQNIADLNRAYNETLESADNLWAQMEKDYKEKLSEAENENSLMKMKIGQLEDRLKVDLISAQERITQLEEVETELKEKINRKNREHKEELVKFEGIANELYVLNEEYTKLKDQFESLTVKNFENETKKIRFLEEELKSVNKFQLDVEEQYAKDTKLLKDQLDQMSKELMYIGVSNGELREEVVTLENRVIELGRSKIVNEETIKNLMAELRNKNDELVKLTPKIKGNNNSLAQELVLCDGDIGFAVKKPKIAAKPLNLKNVRFNGRRQQSLTEGVDFEVDHEAKRFNDA